MSDAIRRQQTRPGVVTLTIARPDRLNALDCASADALREALLSAEADESVRVVALRGEGRAFSTGLDLGDVNPAMDIDLGRILEQHFEPLLQTVRGLSVPVVAAVNGPTAGVSVALAVAADLCLASESAYFLLPFTALGLVPDGGLTWLLPRLAGLQNAAAAALLGERIPARTAMEWGLIWRCLPPQEFEQAIEQCVTRLSALPRGAVAATKMALQDAATLSFGEHLLVERDLQQALGRRPEFRQRLVAFLQR